MPEQPSTPVRRGRLLRVGAAVAVLLGLAGYLVMQYEGGGRAAPRCTVTSGGEGSAGDDGTAGATYELSTRQAVNAATISAVGTSRGMPERAVTIALATALQESGLRNINHGDRDSVGLFQQRPSQGWGTAKQIMDPVYASGKFYAHLDQVPGYSRLPLTVAAQRVQRSGYPQAYAKHEPDAALLAAALTGRAAASLTCDAEPADEPGEPAEVRDALVRDFGREVLSGARGAGDAQRESRADSGSGSGAGFGGGKGAAIGAHTVAVPVTSAVAGDERAGESGREGGRRGWELAHWAVAHAAELRIEKIAFAGREWSASDSEQKWHKASGARAGDKADQVLITTAQ